MSLIVHGVTPSPFVRKVCVVLEEKGVEYTLAPVAFPIDADFARISPLGRMPVLEDTSRPGADPIPDSSVICDFIEQLHPIPALYPADPHERARALWLEEFVDGGVAPHMGPGLFRQRVLSRLLGFEPDEALARRTVDEILPPLFDYLERQARGREFLVGDRLSIADIAVASPFVNYEHAGEALDAERWPSLADLVARMHARPSFAGFIEREKRFFAKLAA